MDGKTVEFIVIHCSATRPSQDIGRDEIDTWHKGRGWLMIGYHIVIRRNGTIETGRPLDMDHVLEPNEVGAHVAGFNSRSVGLCMVGGVSEDAGVPEDNFTKEQWAALDAQIMLWREQFPYAKIVGHRELNPHKECPCFDVEEWLAMAGIAREGD